MQPFWMIILALLFGPMALNSLEPLEVRLSTEQQLKPLFLVPLVDQESGFSKEYLQQLGQVLEFDLGCSGWLQLLPPTRERVSLAMSKNLDDVGIASQWQALNAFYVLKVYARKGGFSAALLSVKDNGIKKFDGFVLCGDLTQDRRQIHRLSDALVKSLFDAQGIASTHLLYTRKYRLPNSKDSVSELWECDYDGGNQRQILNAENGYCVTPVYIPPKPGFQTSTFFYVSYKIGQPKIYIGSLSTGNTQRLLTLRGNQLMPAISAQRDKIAFISDNTGNPDLFLQAFSSEQGPIGKPRQIYTTHQGTQGSPTFSPDGRRLAFVSNKDGTPRIYVMDIPPPSMKAKEIKTTLISRTNRESSAPSWSPDGTKLAYCARNASGIRQIWIYDFQTNREWQLTQGSEHKENPSWAPNSLHLVFNSRSKKGSDLYIINIQERAPIKVADCPDGEKRFPSWEPA